MARAMFDTVVAAARATAPSDRDGELENSRPLRPTLWSRSAQRSASRALRIRVSETGSGGAARLVPEADPELLEHPPHLHQRGARRPALGQRVDPVQVGLLQAARPGPSAAGRGRRAGQPLATGARRRRGSAAARRSCSAPTSETNPRCTSRPTCAFMSARAGSIGISAEPLSALSTSRHCASTRDHVPAPRAGWPPRSPGRTTAGELVERRPRPTPARAARRARRRPPRRSPRAARLTDGYGDPASPSLSAFDSPSAIAFAGDGKRQHQQPAQADAVRGLAAPPRSRTPAARPSYPRRPAPGIPAPRVRHASG